MLSLWIAFIAFSTVKASTSEACYWVTVTWFAIGSLLVKVGKFVVSNFSCHHIILLKTWFWQSVWTCCELARSVLACPDRSSRDISLKTCLKLGLWPGFRICILEFGHCRIVWSWHNGPLLDMIVYIVEGEGGGGMGGTATRSYLYTSAIRRDDIRQQNSEGLVTL